MHHHKRELPLTHVPVGQPVKIIKIQGGRELIHRLVEMGLTPGSEIKILQDTGGPLLLAVRDSRIALGRGMAFRVRVTPHSGHRVPGPRRVHQRPKAPFGKFAHRLRDWRDHSRPNRSAKKHNRHSS